MIIPINKKNKVKTIAIFLFAILEGVLIATENQYTSFVAIGVMLLSVLWDRKIAISNYIIINLLQLELSTIENVICIGVVGAVMALDFLGSKQKEINKFTPATCLFIGLVLFSYVSGIGSQLITIVLFVFRWILVLFIVKLVSKDKHQIIFVSLFAVAVSMLVIIWANPQDAIVYAYNENNKDLSTVLSFPVYFLMWALFNGKINGLLYKILSIVLLGLLLITTIYTYSRGVLLAEAVSILFLLFTFERKHKVLLLVSFILLAIVFYRTVDLQINNERMFSHLEGGNGRTAIWLNFYEIMKSQGFDRILFGCGLNGLLFLSVNGVYSHSAILDYFFSLGLLGLFFIFYVITNTAIILTRNKNWFYLGILILDVFMFIPHGTYDSFLFLILLGLCMGGSCTANNNNVHITNN